MTCDEFERLASKDLPGTGDAEMLAHAAGCAACAARLERDASYADALVAAAATASRATSALRRGAALAVAASLALAASLAVRPRPEPRAIYILRGDANGVLLTGPGITRRSEASPAVLHRRKGDRT